MAYKRVDLKTGFVCNNFCRFCAQSHNRELGNRGFPELIREIDDAYKSGCKEIVFTGGEITIRKDILKLIIHAKSVGFKIIHLQTNGRMLSNPRFCDAVIKAGSNLFSPSLHGPNREIHDSLTRSPGSFNQTVKGIKNLKERKQKVITNTVVTKKNYKTLPEMAELLIGLGVDQFQFAYMHAVGNGLLNIEELMPKMTDAVPYIKKGLKIGLESKLPVMVEAVPLCMMEGYEKCCSEFYIPETEIRTTGDYDPDFTKTRKTLGKIKFDKCKRCMHDAVCEGSWKEYVEKFGDNEFNPKQ